MIKKTDILLFEKKIKDKEKEMDIVKKKMRPISQLIGKIEKELNDMYIERKVMHSQVELLLTEHAILRYIERVKGINIEEIKKEMIPIKLDVWIDGDLNLGTHILRIKNGVVVTCLAVKVTFFNKLKDFYERNIKSISRKSNN